MDLDNLLAAYTDGLEKYRVLPGDTDPSVFDYHLPLLRQLDCVENSSAALFDMSIMGYRFLTERFKFLLDYSRDEALEKGSDYFFRLMKAEDAETFVDTSLRAFTFLYAQPVEKRKDFKTCQDFRIRRSDGVMIRMLQQMLVLETDTRGNIWLVLIVNDLSPEKRLDVPARRYMENIRTGERCCFHAEDDEEVPLLTRREIEILGLVARGYASRDIAGFLSISVNTVNNHRQNILEKTNTASSAEAVRYAAGLGLL